MSATDNSLDPPDSQSHEHRAGSTGEVFLTFLRLGLTSFGGPIAHLGYMRREIVERRQWLGDTEFAQVLALCQFLPGPASSQLGFSLGLLRAGWPGALAAFVAFTAPSALLLFAFAALLPRVTGPLGDAAVHGLKIVALAVVAQGVLGMARQLCPARRVQALLRSPPQGCCSSKRRGCNSASSRSARWRVSHSCAGCSRSPYRVFTFATDPCLGGRSLPYSRCCSPACRSSRRSKEA
jgi:chromate transport protein ChrA